MRSVLVFASLLAVAAVGCDGHTSVEGRVVDPAGKPVPEVAVKLTQQPDNPRLGMSDTDTTSGEKKSEPSHKSYTAGKKTETTHKIGETVSIGYTSYSVWRAWWSNRLSDNEFLNEKPDASFLFIELSVRNDDKKPRTIPPFKLIDENGAEYEQTSKSWSVEGSIGVLDSLNPAVTKQGKIVFDVPRTHQYNLSVSGGYWSSERALFEIVGKAAFSPPADTKDHQPKSNARAPSPKPKPKAKVEEKVDPERKAERMAIIMLTSAKVLMDKNNRESAKKWLQDLLNKYPETEAASEAKVLLEQIDQQQ